MIYNIITPENLEQGDICTNLPKISSNQINYKELMETWINNVKSEQSFGLPTKPSLFNGQPIKADGVILTQSCDIRPNSSILFAELREKKALFSEKTKGRLNQITKIIHDETRNHYFPPENKIEILKTPKILDFKSLFLIPYDCLTENINFFFVARLKTEARSVLCEKISRFFTRLAFEDIMFFTDEEIIQYATNRNVDIKEINKTLSVFNRTIKSD